MLSWVKNKKKKYGRQGKFPDFRGKEVVDQLGFCGRQFTAESSDALGFSEIKWFP